MTEKYKIEDEMFRILTEYCNRGDNGPDNLHRAELLGLGGRGIMVAPGAIIRVPLDQIGKNCFIGLYSYLNGNVTVGDNCLIGPHCSPPETTNSIRRQAGFPRVPRRMATIPS